MEASARPHPLGAAWERDRFRQLGWCLFPLRVFLGVTFLYAALQKLANPDYLRASSPTSVAAQMRSLESSSPIGPLLRVSLHAPTLVGVLIALGELAVACGILAGLWTRLAAIGGMLLSLTFFLTVSWSTVPYYYGSDIVFIFAWSVFAACGAGGVLSLDAWIEARAASAGVRGDAPLDQVRRKLLVGARSTAMLAGIAGLLGGATALIGRAAGGTSGPARAALGGPKTTTPSPSPRHRHRSTTSPAEQTSPSPTPATQKSSKAPTGTALAPVSAVPIGQGRRFTDPQSGQPAWLLRPSRADVLAFSAVCTHAGCAVDYDASANEFICPCHGGRYSAQSGAVLGGPPPAPLSKIPARIENSEIRVDT